MHVEVGLVRPPGYALHVEVHWEGHADAQCRPWHPGVQHTWALGQPEVCEHLSWFQLRQTGLPQ